MALNVRYTEDEVKHIAYHVMNLTLESMHSSIEDRNNAELIVNNFLDFTFNPTIEVEPTIPITLGMIKATCGWSEYATVTGENVYMLNEWNVSDTEIFETKVSDARKLGLIK